MLWLRECADREIAEVGAKAQRLGRALRLSLRVPDGVLILPDEPLEKAAIADALGKLGGERFAVRSSAAAEDLLGRSAAGLFLSLTQVSSNIDDIVAAIGAVRESGQSATVRSYTGGAVPVAVLIQPMVAAERLGVLYLSTDGHAVCEERPADAPEWANVMVRALPEREMSALSDGARRLAALLHEERPAQAPTAAYIEYALESATTDRVSFLQVRPAPPPPRQEQWPKLSGADARLCYIHDQEHNPDPLSRAQAELVEGVADLVPSMHQRVYRGYLYYAERRGAEPLPTSLPPIRPEDLAARFQDEIAPACEALLQPLERHLCESDGALSAALLADPSSCELSIGEAFSAYRGVYLRYVGQLAPALRRARQALDQFLRKNLGESLSNSRHATLLAGAGEAPTERLQKLFELGMQDAPPLLLRAYLARYGAFAPCWDVAVPCDDEHPQNVRAVALSLAKGRAQHPSPKQQHAAAEASHHSALLELVDRLPRTLRGELETLLPLARAAQRIGEEDDALFFRAQRLLRWALLRRGADLVQAGRLDRLEQVFDLTGSLVEQAEPIARDLRSMAAEGKKERLAAQALVPPARLVDGQPLWTPPRAEVLCGCGVADKDSGPVRGRARVVRSLLPTETPAQSGEPQPDDEVQSAAAADEDEDVILVLPALLPSWAAKLWRARALITDSGGALSHGAILARERGVPAVVGTRVATQTIRDGQELWVDALRGRVYLIS